MFCNFPRIIHKWGKWQTYDKGNLKHELTSKCGNTYSETLGSFEDQRRECECCGKVQLRTAFAPAPN